MQVVLANAFSLKMLPPEAYTVEGKYNLLVGKVPPETVRFVLTQEGMDLFSAIGHESTAMVLSKRLGVEIPTQRVDVTLPEVDEAVFIVAQVELPRLAEGQVLTESEMENVPVTFYEVARV